MWFPPERFSGWYAHLTNQGSHGGLVGAGLSFLVWPFLPPVAAWAVVVLGYFLYEAVVGYEMAEDWVAEWDWRDSVDDTANVAGGAAVVIGALSWGYTAAVLGFGVWCASLALSVWRRL